MVPSNPIILIKKFGFKIKLNNFNQYLPLVFSLPAKVFLFNISKHLIQLS